MPLRQLIPLLLNLLILTVDVSRYALENPGLSQELFVRLRRFLRRHRFCLLFFIFDSFQGIQDIDGVLGRLKNLKILCVDMEVCIDLQVRILNLVHGFPVLRREIFHFILRSYHLLVRLFVLGVPKRYLNLGVIKGKAILAYVVVAGHRIDLGVWQV